MRGRAFPEQPEFNFEAPLPEPKDLLAEIADLFPGGAGRVIADTFRRMEIAEEEISAARESHPDASTRLEAAFGALVPTEPLSGLSDELYRHHARELLERAAAGVDLRPATAAEMLGALSRGSLTQPPGQTMKLLYFELFSEVFPGKAVALGLPTDLSHVPAYDREEAAELRRELARKLSEASRRTPAEKTRPTNGS